MEDWNNNDKNLLSWREATGQTAFEQTPAGEMEIAEQLTLTMEFSWLRWLRQALNLLLKRW